MIYYVIMSILLLYGLLFQGSTFQYFKVHLKGNFILLSILLICFAGFRYGLEADYFAYKEIFFAPSQSAIVERYEPGFKLFINIYKSLLSSENFNGFVFVFAFISMGLKCLYFYRSENGIIALFVYFTLMFIMMEMNGIRQGIAVSFLFFALEEAKNRKMIRFFLLVLLASSFHISSLIFFPVYFIVNQKVSIRQIGFFVILSLAAKLFIVPMSLSLLEKIQIPALRLYILMVKSHLVNGSSGKIVTMGGIRRLVILFLFILLEGKKRFSNPYFNLYLLGSLMYLLFMGNETMAGRMSMSFEVFAAPFIANLSVKYSWEKIYVLLAYLFLCILLFIILLSNSPNAIPYKTYLWGTL